MNVSKGLRYSVLTATSVLVMSLYSCSSSVAVADDDNDKAAMAAQLEKAESMQSGDEWQKSFDPASCNLVTTGRNDYFVLEPGHKLILEGDNTKVEIKVLEETKMVAGVETRVVKESEWKKGKLYEVAMNYFAICEDTKDVYYFGEDVSFYKNGKVVNHDGAWVAGDGENKAGLFMPGKVATNLKYYQEVAPGQAMDRAEIISFDGVCETPAGTFKNCLKVKEGTPLDESVLEYKYYAPGIGLIIDDDILLTSYES